MFMRIFIDNAKCIVNESDGYSPRMQPVYIKQNVQTFLKFTSANVGTFRVVEDGRTTCYEDRKDDKVRLHRFYRAVVAYLRQKKFCRAEHKRRKLRSKLDSGSRSAKKK